METVVDASVVLQQRMRAIQTVQKVEEVPQYKIADEVVNNTRVTERQINEKVVETLEVQGSSFSDKSCGCFDAEELEMEHCRV